MSRTATMTLGFVLIFLGTQLALVDSFLLTPRVSHFLSQQAPAESLIPNPNGNSGTAPINPFSQAGYQSSAYGQQPILSQAFSAQKRIQPPNWLCWPVLFCGTVVLLHGATMNRN